MTIKSIDNVETKKLVPILEQFLEKIDLSFEGSTEITELEYISRDGFSAFDRNRGGMDLICITDNASLICSGYHCGTSIETEVNESFDNTCKKVKEDNPEFTEDRVFEEAYNIESDVCSGQAFRVRLMYEGENTLVIHAGWDKDAPYFRWSNASELEAVIKFKNKNDLKTKLNKILKKINELA